MEGGKKGEAKGRDREEERRDRLKGRTKGRKEARKLSSMSSVHISTDEIGCYGNGILSTLQVVYEVCSQIKDISKQGGKLSVCESCDS